MKSPVKNKIYAIIIVVVSGLIVVLLGNYIADYYQNRNIAIPKWIYWSSLILFNCILALAYSIFKDLFSKNKKDNFKKK